MNATGLLRALLVALVCALLAGCGAALPGGSASIINARARHSASWMLPEAREMRGLLYVSLQYDDIVLVYDYRTGREVGVLQGQSYPQGQCVDAEGDIWITNNAAFSVVEYPHGGSGPIQTVTTDNYPFACSIDPMTGNLAVASFDESSGNGDVEVFPADGGAPSSYTSPSCKNLSSPGYDNKGNLYFLARNPTNACELPSEGTTLRTVPLDVTITSPGGVMWDGKHLTLTDWDYGSARATLIYQVRELQRGSLRVVGNTQLGCNGRSNDLQAPFIVGRTNTPRNTRQGNVVLGADYFCNPYGFDFWRYPGGGNPFRTIYLDEAPSGASVSFATSTSQ